MQLKAEASQLKIYNTLTGNKDIFKPINENHVGMYVCGPTVYSNVHLGNVRTFMSFDMIFRYFKHLGYKVRYVRNITDVGHLTDDADAGEDKIAKKARLEKIEPMEIVQRYTVDFHNVLDTFNFLPPSIEPTATGHIIEQIEIIKSIINKGLAYEINGSVYFDVHKFDKNHDYGKLSGRNLEDLVNNSRALDGQSDKKNPQDFALWKKAEPEHIMSWPSPWSAGFPGWHLECTAMSTKYLGEQFDIHGGGMDLKFPHHECEIAQAEAWNGQSPVNYWMHANMLKMNGQKMSKSTGNSINPDELLSGNNDILSKAYSPSVIRFFMMQSSYRSILDLTDDGLLAAEKGYNRLMEAVTSLKNLSTSSESSSNTKETLAILKSKFYEAMNDDFNTPILISWLFDGVTVINKIKSADETISPEDLKEFTTLVHSFVFDVMGLQNESTSSNEGSSKLEGVVDMLINMRKDARENKDFETSDRIRDELLALGIQLKDGKDGTTFTTN